MKRWGAPLLNDLSATGNDMTTGCALAFTGDVTMTVSCRIFLCHPTGETFEDLDLAGPIDNPTGAHAIFEVDGAFAARSHARAELRTSDVGVMVGGKDYRAQGSNGTAALTLGAVTPASGSDSCSGVAHGSATATLVELDGNDGGVQSPGPGRVMLSASF